MSDFTIRCCCCAAVGMLAATTLCAAGGCGNADADDAAASTVGGNGAADAGNGAAAAKAGPSFGIRRSIVTMPSLDLDFVAAGEVVAAEEQGRAYQDPETGKMAWRAFTCQSPNCPGEGNEGRPFTFAPQLAGAVVLPDARVVFPQLTLADMERVGHPVCPACGQSDQTVRYDPPEVVARRAELLAELTAARAARREAKRAGRSMPDGHRTPTEIMHEHATLPRIYLVVE